MPLDCPVCASSISDQAPSCPKCGHPMRRPEKPSPESLDKESPKEPSPLIGLGAAFVVLSIIAFLWAHNYMDGHVLSDFSSMTGRSDPIDQVANGAALVSPFIFVVALALFIIGLTKNR